MFPFTQMWEGCAFERSITVTNLIVLSILESKNIKRTTRKMQQIQPAAFLQEIVCKVLKSADSQSCHQQSCSVKTAGHHPLQARICSFLPLTVRVILIFYTAARKVKGHDGKTTSHTLEAEAPCLLLDDHAWPLCADRWCRQPAAQQTSCRWLIVPSSTRRSSSLNSECVLMPWLLLSTATRGSCCPFL